jgi:hypothetical protein
MRWTRFADNGGFRKTAAGARSSVSMEFSFADRKPH